MAVTWLSRADWGAGPLRSGHLAPHTQFVGLVAHHTVIVMPDYDHDGFLDGDLDDICAYMRQLQHARPDLGDEVPYSTVHFFGANREDSVVAEGRGFGVTGAHTIGYNSSRYGCAFAGNSIDQPVTDGVMAGYRFVGRQLANPAHASPTIGHRDVNKSACPGTSLYLRLTEIQPPFTELIPSPPQEDDMASAFFMKEDNPAVAQVWLAGPEVVHPQPVLTFAKAREYGMKVLPPPSFAKITTIRDGAGEDVRVWLIAKADLPRFGLT